MYQNSFLCAEKQKKRAKKNGSTFNSSLAFKAIFVFLTVYLAFLLNYLLSSGDPTDPHKQYNLGLNLKENEYL